MVLMITLRILMVVIDFFKICMIIHLIQNIFMIYFITKEI
jgi:hypothetical protein